MTLSATSSSSPTSVAGAWNSNCPLSSLSSTAVNAKSNNKAFPMTEQQQQQQPPPLLNPRSCILQVGVSTGKLCGVANSHLLDNNNNTSKNNKVLVMAMSALIVDLYQTSLAFDLHLVTSIRHKMKLNAMKYPVSLCKGKAGKYTQYSQVTGITETNQSTRDFDDAQKKHGAMTLEELIQEVPQVAEDIAVFAMERDWAQHHTPRNLVLALLGEVGELAELVQWMKEYDDTTPTTPDAVVALLSPEKLDKVSQELADVSIYLLRLATVCGVVPSLCESLEEEHL